VFVGGEPVMLGLWLTGVRFLGGPWGERRLVLDVGSSDFLV